MFSFYIKEPMRTFIEDYIHEFQPQIGEHMNWVVFYKT